MTGNSMWGFRPRVSIHNDFSKRISQILREPNSAPQTYRPSQQFLMLAKFDPSLMRPPFPKASVFHRGKKRMRSLTERIHIAISDPAESKFGLVFVSVVIVVILLSCVTFVLESMPEFQVYSNDCQQCKPITGDNRKNETLLAEREKLLDVCLDCAPSTASVFFLVETISVSIFTLEYLIRLCTAHEVMMPSEVSQDVLFAREVPQSQLGLRRTLAFALTPLNIIDLAAIMPYYIGLALGNEGGALAVLRVLRMFRIFRVLRFGHLSQGVNLFVRVMQMSLLSFWVFLIFSTFGMVVFASLVFNAESGNWDPATGEFMRQGLYYLSPKEASPFTSIPQSFWWVLVTFSTVGYGDMVPTSKVGQLLGSLTMYLGIILVAMPITIMSVNLQALYEEEKLKWQRERRIAFLGAQVLHNCIIGRRQAPLRRAWNKWRRYAMATPREDPVITEMRRQLSFFARNLESRICPPTIAEALDSDISPAPSPMVELRRGAKPRPRELGTPSPVTQRHVVHLASRPKGLSHIEEPATSSQPTQISQSEHHGGLETEMRQMRTQMEQFFSMINTRIGALEDTIRAQHKPIEPSTALNRTISEVSWS